MNSTTFRLYKWQGDIISDSIFPYLGGRDYPRYNVVKSRRQVGKSIVILQMLIMVAMKKKGSISAVIEPIFSQSQRLQKQLKRMGGKMIKSCNMQDGIVEFLNGSQVCFFSASSDDSALRGPTVSGILCIDEAAFISDETYNTVLPWCDVHKAPIFLVSTPKFKHGFFWDEYCRAENGDGGYALYDWADKKYEDRKYCGGKVLSDILSDEALEHYRSILSKIAFQTDYMAQFIDAESMLFGDVRRLVAVPDITDKKVVAGIDFGSGNDGDYTAITILNSKGEEVYVGHWNKGGALAQVEWIKEVLNKHIADGYDFKKVLCESNNMGSTMYELLKKSYDGTQFGSRLGCATTTNDSKIEMITALEIAFDQGTCKLLDCDWHLHELVSYEQGVSPSGKLTFNGRNAHDDSVMALAYAWLAWNGVWGRKVGKYVLS